MRQRKRCLLLIAICLLAGCGGVTGTPTQPPALATSAVMTPATGPDSGVAAAQATAIVANAVATSNALLVNTQATTTALSTRPGSATPAATSQTGVYEVGYLIDGQQCTGGKCYLIFFAWNETNGTLSGIMRVAVDNQERDYVTAPLTGTRAGTRVQLTSEVMRDPRYGGQQLFGLPPLEGQLQGGELAVTFPIRSIYTFRRAGERDFVRALQAFWSASSRQATTHIPSVAPTAQGSRFDTNQPSGVAQELIQAAIANDLPRAQRLYAPDKRPGSWLDILGGLKNAATLGTGAVRDIPNTAAECRGVTYQIVERQVQYGGVPASAVTLVFASRCAAKYEFSTFPYYWTEERVSRITVYVERSTGRWYVDDVSFEP